MSDDEIAFLTAFGTYDTHAIIKSDGEPNEGAMAGLPYDTITWSEILAFAKNPMAVEKEVAQLVILSTYHSHDGRTHDVQRERGIYYALAADIDCHTDKETGVVTNSHDIEVVVGAVKTIVGAAQVAIYSSSGASHTKKKWRVLILLASPLAGADYSDTQEALFSLLADHGIECDDTLAGTAQPIYLPNVPPDRRGADGIPLFYDFRHFDEPPLALTPDHPIIARREAIKAEIAAAEAESEKQRQDRDARKLRHVQGTGDDFDAFEHFTTMYSVEEMLARYGFEQNVRRKGSHWRSPLAESKSFSVQTAGGKWWTVSAWAERHGIGRQSSKSRIWYGDAFDLYVHFEHNGDRTAAMRACREHVRQSPPAASSSSLPTSPIGDSTPTTPPATKIAAAPAITMEPIPGGSRAVMTACNSETGEVVDIDAIDLAKAKDRYTYSVRVGAKFEGVDLAAIDKQLLDMAGQRVSSEKPVDRPKPRSLVDIIDSWRKRECKPRVATGFQWFDGPTKGGLPVGGMVGLFAPPKSFKSALALQLVMGAMHTDPDLRVVWARGEMTEEDFADRCTAIGSGIIADCELVTVEDCEKRTPAAVRAAMRVVEEFYDRITWVPPKLTAADIEAEVVRTGAKVCAVDYLQKVALPGGGKDRVNDIDTIVEQVREMTERLGLATILISSMAKPTSGTGSHLGQLGRGSVDIGHAVEIGYEAVIKRNDEGDPIEDADGFIPVRWRCAGARSIKAVDLRLRFDGPQMTHEDADSVMPFRELGDGAFTVGAPR
jgi:KaiC/GvpD/RAD55 family RecA-like ATPase